MKARPILALLLTGSAAAFTPDAAAEWPTAAGTYSLEDYVRSGNSSIDLNHTPEGDQIFNVTEAHNSMSCFWIRPGGDHWVTFRGEAMNASTSSSGNNNFRLFRGNWRIENAVTSGIAQNYLGYTGPAQLAVGNGGSLTATKDNVSIGRKYSDPLGSASCSVYIEKGGTISPKGVSMWVGNGQPGALWVEGGTLDVSNGTFGGSGAASEGYVRLSDGTISLRAENADTMAIGAYGGYSSLHVSGGTLSTKYAGTSLDGERYVTVGGKAQTRPADVYVDGGTLDFHSRRFALGKWDSNVAGWANLTVDGTGTAMLNLICMTTSGSGTSVLNLNGGTLQLSRGFADYGNKSGRRYVNFNGGKMSFVKWDKNFTGSLNKGKGIVVYPKGGVLETTLAEGQLDSAEIRVAKGYGVKEIVLTNPGSGYVTAPQVTLTGGSGSNATAYAVLKKDRTLEKIVVTCRGEGYAANDELTVTIAATLGSGATATATLDSNTQVLPTLRKIGDERLTLTGKIDMENAFSADAGALRLYNANVASCPKFSLGDGIWLRPARAAGVVTTNELCRCDVVDNVARLRYEGGSDCAQTKLRIGTLNCENGLLLVDYFDNTAMELKIDATDLVSPSAVSPVISGVIDRYENGSNYREPKLLERGTDGVLRHAETTATPGADANWLPEASTTVAFDKVNSVTLPLTPAVEAYVKSDNKVEIQSGMILFRRPHVNGNMRLVVDGNGAFTTRAKGGMIYYNDQFETTQRTSGTDKSANWGGTRRMLGPFADPDDATPMSFTVVGERKGRPEQGVVAWLISSRNTYTGGLRLCNGGVVFAVESALGGSVTVAGNCSLAHYNASGSSNPMTVDSAPICLKAGSALLVSPSAAVKSGNRIGSALSGSGDLLTSDIGRPGYAVAFTGDHTAFDGNYYIMGDARIEPATFSANAGICLADATNGVGVIAASGRFTRPLGTGKGEICWKRHATMPSSKGLRGGFAAFGGDLAVNLGGAGAAVVAGSAALPEGTEISLQSSFSNGALTFENAIDLNGKVQVVKVWSGKTAKLTGGLSDSVGGGSLKVEAGTLVYGGAIKATIGPDGLTGNAVVVDGDLTLDGATVELDDPDGNLAKLAGRTFPLLTVSGKLTGKFVKATSNPYWVIRTTSKGVTLQEAKGVAVLLH